jgi:selenocysteine lyase/cysteine desulfurase
MDWLSGLGVTVDGIHSHVHALQRAFVDRLSVRRLAALGPQQLVIPIEEANRGHFLTFRTAEAGTLHQRLLDAGIVTDYRGDRLRFGFGLYHDPEDIDRLCERLAAVLA